LNCTFEDVTTTANQAQSGALARPLPRWTILEGLILLAVAPFLLVPEIAPAATAVAFVALAATWLVSLRLQPLPSTPFNLVLLLWGGVLIVGILATADPAETLPKAAGLVLGLAVWRYLVIALRDRRHVALAAVSFALLCALFSLVSLAGLEELPKIPFLGRLNPFSVLALPGQASAAIHPNQLAGLIGLYLPLIVSMLAVPPAGLSPRLRLVLAPAALLALFVLLLTQSRGGWIGAALGLFALLILWALTLPPSGSRRALRLVAVSMILGVVAAAAWIGPERMRDLWLNPPAETAIGALTTLDYRKDLWPWAVTAIGDFPLSGVGLGAFKLVVFRLYPVAITAGDIGHAHNIFLQTALDVGLAGLVVYLAILFVAVAVGLRIARRDAGFRSISLGLLAGLVAVHVFGLADAIALGAKPGIALWFALGLLAAMSRREQAVAAEAI
jgi:putative inorganic carbon (HCO3(-)) transporter